jgi:glycosyltransferase involved in cell wall biosynthesis
MMDVELCLKRSLFVIPSINGALLLERMLPSLSVPSNILVVIDQGSTDNTLDICMKFGAQVIQLGKVCTYTEACNIGAQLAKERGAEFLFVSNNDIEFITDVARQLIAVMLEDPNLSIAAPSQVLVDAITGKELVAYRAFWSLERMLFEHDFTPPPARTERIEADFCELTCAIVRMSTIDRIGFLDDDFGFYHEDADFGFRVRSAGFTSAYVPKAQIKHFVSSTMGKQPSERKLRYIEQNKSLFARKHLGYGVKHQKHMSTEPTSWNIINRHLHRYLTRAGLVDDSRPELLFSHPGIKPFDYLYTVWETNKLPQDWRNFASRYEIVFTPSRWNQSVFAASGFPDVRYVPHGVETDVFAPWGPTERQYDEVTFLWFSRNQYRKGLDVMLAAWSELRRHHSRARLIVLGVGVLQAFKRQPESQRRWNNMIICEYPEDGISVRELIEPFDDLELSSVYRSVDFVVCTSRSEGFGFVVPEAMACGTVPIFPSYGATGEFAVSGSLIFPGQPISADYSDMGFSNVGEWWEPEVQRIAASLARAVAMDARERRDLVAAGLALVRTNFTWRSTCSALHSALADIQVQKLNSSSVNQSLTLDRSIVPMSESANLSEITISAESNATDKRPRTIGGRLKRRVAKFRRSYEKRRDKYLRRTDIEQTTNVVKTIDSVLFVGYAEGALGLGESFRDMLQALYDSGMSFRIYPFTKNIETRIAGAFLPLLYDANGLYDINVAYFAADQLPFFFEQLRKQTESGAYNILRTYWELPKAPQEWRPLLARIDEIWAPNSFVADAFRPIFDGAITIIPTCVRVARTTTFDRVYFCLEKETFYFLFSYDFYSGTARKNPLAVVQAFTYAFPDRKYNVGLVIKSVGPEQLDATLSHFLEDAARLDDRIKVINRAMSREEMLSLTAECDCYISLHRSEGFGAGMAEAMALGRPVIGTDFSGNTDFLTRETGFPVPFTVRPLMPGEYAYWEGQAWAEPDLEIASKRMRCVFEDSQEREKRARRGRQYIEKYYCSEIVAQKIGARLDEIKKARSSRAVA